MAIYVGDKRYAPYVGSKRRKVMTEKTLPYDAEIEYLETTGTQWINTRISATTNVAVKTRIVVTTTSLNIPVFGSLSKYEGTKSSSGGKTYHLTPYNSKWFYGTNGTEGSFGTYVRTAGSVYDIEFNVNNSIIVNGVSTNVTINEAYSDNYLTISYRGNTSYIYGIWKYIYFKIFEGSELVMDLIPVRVGQTGYMYDMVSGELFGNAGTGNFVLGPDINN